jgi:hypothetical protein
MVLQRDAASKREEEQRKKDLDESIWTLVVQHDHGFRIRTGRKTLVRAVIAAIEKKLNVAHMSLFVGHEYMYPDDALGEYEDQLKDAEFHVRPAEKIDVSLRYVAENAHLRTKAKVNLDIDGFGLWLALRSNIGQRPTVISINGTRMDPEKTLRAYTKQLAAAGNVIYFADAPVFHVTVAVYERDNTVAEHSFAVTRLMQVKYIETQLNRLYGKVFQLYTTAADGTHGHRLNSSSPLSAYAGKLAQSNFRLRYTTS